jgi:ribosomal protein S18 acetylase RimI-like enzyme
MITPLRLEHVDRVARLHCETLNGLLTRLGVPAASAFYRGCTRSDIAVGLVDVADGVLRGFVVGSVHPDRLNGDVLRRNPFDTLVSVATGVVTNPSSLTLLLENVRRPEEALYDRQAPSLVYLAVAPEARRAGVGRTLVDAFSERMRAAGAGHYDLSVDEDNASAIAFYERLGFKPIGTYREFGATHRRYRLTL